MSFGRHSFLVNVAIRHRMVEAIFILEEGRDAGLFLFSCHLFVVLDGGPFNVLGCQNVLP